VTPLHDLAGPTDAELWGIEADAELLAAELALVDAEIAWFTQPSCATAADFLRALVDLADLHDLCDHRAAEAVA
jgi:hypothetical protein